MRLHWVSEAAVGNQHLEDYVRSFTIDVKAFDDDLNNEFLVGRLAVDQVLWRDALQDGESLFEICDCDSQGLHELHVIMTNGTNDIRKDLDVTFPVDFVIFVHSAIFHSSVRSFRVAILDAVFRLFGVATLAVMWQTVGETPVEEQVELGLAKVAGTDLVFRHNADPSPYLNFYPRGMDIELDATSEMEQWVLNEWRLRFDPLSGYNPL